jgi:hypothetical protein
MNLLNQNWGWVRTITNQQAYLLTFAGYSGNIPVYTVGTITDNSYNLDPASRWEL